MVQFLNLILKQSRYYFHVNTLQVDLDKMTTTFISFKRNIYTNAGILYQSADGKLQSKYIREQLKIYTHKKIYRQNYFNNLETKI